MIARSLGLLALAAALLVVFAAFGSSGKPELIYKPEFLPIELGIGGSGISVHGDESLLTPIGSFSIGAHYSLEQLNSGNIYVILRNRKNGYDQIFQVHSGSGSFSAVINGSAEISVTNDQVMIDVTSGSIKQIRFKRVNTQIGEQGKGGWLQNEQSKLHARWEAGWNQSWYKPYALARWSYSDSTMSKWFGIGFIWFLLRLILTVILAIVDTLLTAGFLLGQVGFVIFGPTGRDVIYGLLVLSVVVVVISAGAVADSLLLID